MKLVKSSALLLALSAAFSTTYAAENQSKLYQPTAAVDSSQTQVVFYRENDAQQGSANIYLNGEFQSSLKQQSFTRFCLAPGNHSFGAFLHDAPMYRGKLAQPLLTNMEAGKTYFLKMGDGHSGRPLAVSQADAEQQLYTMHQQTRILSRASAVEACQYVNQE